MLDDPPARGASLALPVRRASRGPVPRERSSPVRRDSESETAAVKLSRTPRRISSRRWTQEAHQPDSGSMTYSSTVRPGTSAAPACRASPSLTTARATRRSRRPLKRAFQRCTSCVNSRAMVSGRCVSASSAGMPTTSSPPLRSTKPLFSKNPTKTTSTGGSVRPRHASSCMTSPSTPGVLRAPPPRLPRWRPGTARTAAKRLQTSPGLASCRRAWSARAQTAPSSATAASARPCWSRAGWPARKSAGIAPSCPAATTARLHPPRPHSASAARRTDPYLG